MIRRVAIVGGTHGNELTGAYLVKKFEACPDLMRRSSFESLALLANPKAFAAGRRYIDRDLNRCFLSARLNDLTLTSYEDSQAKAIHTLLGPKGNANVDFIVDLHSSTANMGLTIIPASDHPFNLRLAAHLQTIIPQVRVYRWISSGSDAPFLRSLSPLGCAIEVGAVAQGVLDATLFQQTEQLIHAVLDYLNLYNQTKITAHPETLTVYQCVELADYPRNEKDELLAMVHPERQFHDYEPMHPGDPMFLTFAGETIAYSGATTTYPVFINEAAYYEKAIAMCLTQPQEIRLNS